MHKKNYKSPSKEDLFVGNILPIFLDYKSQKNFRGNAILLSKFESPNFIRRYPELQRVYVRAEIGIGDLYDKQTIIWSWERWKIKFVDGNDEDFQTAVNIAYYLTTDNYYLSGYERDSLL